MTSLAVTASGSARSAIARLVPPMVVRHSASSAMAASAQRIAPPRRARPLIGEIGALRSEFADQGLQRVTLLSSPEEALAAHALCAAARLPLTVITELPVDVGVLGEQILVTHRVLTEAETGRLADAGVLDQTVVVALPDSRAAAWAESVPQARLIRSLAPFSGPDAALTALSLAPAGLAGLDLAELLHEADEIHDVLAEDDADNPLLAVAAALRHRTIAWQDETVAGPEVLDWVRAVVGAPERDDLPKVTVRRVDIDDESPATGDEVRVSGSLGAEVLLWLGVGALRAEDPSNPSDHHDTTSGVSA